MYSTCNTPQTTRNHLNHGFQQPIELREDNSAAVVRRSFLSMHSGNSHFYDTIGNEMECKPRSDSGLSSHVYSMPEADYSLIIEQRQNKVR